MIKYLFLLLICFSLCAAGCHTGRKVTYDIPMDFPEEMRREAFSLSEKGRVLYKQYCTECHGIFTKGKKGIPNFTTVQLDNYSGRFLKGDPKSHAVAMKMSPEQLNQVIIFLRFKKTDVKIAAAKTK